MFFLYAACNLFAQKICIKDTNGKSIAKASIVVVVKYKATGYIFDSDKEKVFTQVTDTSGVVELKGEFRKDNFSVKSVSIEIKHEDYSDYVLNTSEYSNDPKFVYNVFLAPKNKDVNIVGMSAGNNDKNELDIYSASEIAKKLHTKEEDIIKLIESGKLKGKKIGEKYFVSGSELRSYLSE